MRKRRVLFLTGNIFPCHSGDAIFASGVVENLTTNYDVDVLSFENRNFSKNDRDYLRLKAVCNSICLIKAHQESILSKIVRLIQFEYSFKCVDLKIAQKMREMVKNEKYDFVIIDHLRMYEVYKMTKKYIDGKSEIILIEQNVEFLNIRESIQFETSFYLKIKKIIMNYNLKKYEIRAIRSVDILWTLSEEDLDTLVKVSGFNKATKVVSPSGYYDRVKTEESLRHPNYKLLFLGSMSWYPNVVGVKYFIDNIFKNLLKVDDRYKLYIVGNTPDVSLLKYESSNVIITGTVPTTDNYIEMCDFLILPNKLGSGVKIKVLESILKGLPVISFKEGIVGYPKALFSNGFCPETDDQFVNSILEINSKPQLKVDFINEAQNFLKNQESITLSI